MDLGCLDIGCISVSDKKLDSESVLVSENKENDAGSVSVTATSKIGKNKQMKENGQTTLNSINKSASQIKKPGHRRNSPINWFPRKKVDSYLHRKIKMLQEVAGMNLTLDETLGDSNPHYSKVLKEKMAAREAANKAIEARKAALVEASWCRILKAARIQRKEAEAQLLEAEETAAEAFEAALAIGVNMYDIPNCPQKPRQVETSSYTREGSNNHGVTASFETAFEVDKEVAASVKSALIRHANSSSFQKDEFKDLLRKISQNPDTDENEEEQSKDSSPKHESKSSGLEIELVAGKDLATSLEPGCKITSASQLRRRKSKKRQSLERLNATRLENMMFDRLERLQEDELSSLATIVATCGLNAALAKIENNKLHDPESCADHASRRMSSWGVGKVENFRDGHVRKKQVEPEIPSLDKFLVKHVTKLERDVQEARNSKKDKESKEIDDSVKNVTEETADLDTNTSKTLLKTVPDSGSAIFKHSSENEKPIEEAKINSVGDSKTGHKNLKGDAIPDLGSLLTKHSSKLEKEIEEAKKNFNRELTEVPKKLVSRVNKDTSELPGLDKFLVKRLTRLEKEVQEAKDRRQNEDTTTTNLKSKTNDLSGSVAQDRIASNSDSSGLVKGKENEGDPNMNVQAKQTEDSQGNILVKPLVHRLQREFATECESLDKVLVKHVSKLERDKLRVVMAGSEESELMKSKKHRENAHSHTEESGGLDQILVKHKSRLEREKMVASQEQADCVRVRVSSVSRREARERELQEAWGGLGLGNSMKPHLSKLERDKAAWIKAEEEERKQAMVFSD